MLDGLRVQEDAGILLPVLLRRCQQDASLLILTVLYLIHLILHLLRNHIVLLMATIYLIGHVGLPRPCAGRTTHIASSLDNVSIHLITELQLLLHLHLLLN